MTCTPVPMPSIGAFQPNQIFLQRNQTTISSICSLAYEHASELEAVANNEDARMPILTQSTSKKDFFLSTGATIFGRYACEIISMDQCLGDLDEDNRLRLGGVRTRLIGRL